VALYASTIWLKVNCRIILFVVLSFICKQVVEDIKPACPTVVLLLELLLIINFGPLILDNVLNALLLLLVSNSRPLAGCIGRSEQYLEYGLLCSSLLLSTVINQNYNE
jgi:hypothetical protein